MKLLEGKTTLVTGASRGIGRGIALKLAEHGANVAFTYLSSPDKALDLENELKAFNIKAKGYKSDAADFKSAEELINSIVTEFSTLEIVVNNAGITRDGLLMRMSEENFDDVIRTNLKSVFNITKAIQRPMLKTEKWFHYKYFFCCRNKRKCRPGELCSFKSRYYWFYKIGGA